jgi:selenocysteine lyase/cysteine desulfurase
VAAPDPRQIIWTGNCTEAINLGLKGVLRPGDRVVTTAFEHNAVARPLRALERRRGVTLVRVPAVGGRFDLPSFLNAVTPGTALVVMAHASNVTGEILPVEAVASACRQRGVRLMLDAAQTAGAYPLSVAHADLVAFSGHKGLLGPAGTGALYLSPELCLEPLREGGTGSRSELDEQPEELPDRYESGTLNGPGLAGLDAALGWLEQHGGETLCRREKLNTEGLLRGLAAIPGITLFGPVQGERVGVVSFRLAGWEPDTAAAVLDQEFGIQCRAGLHCAPWAHAALGTLDGGTVRLSPGPFTTDTEIETVLRAVQALAEA